MQLQTALSINQPATPSASHTSPFKLNVSSQSIALLPVFPQIHVAGSPLTQATSAYARAPHNLHISISSTRLQGMIGRAKSHNFEALYRKSVKGQGL